ncbi:MAG: hypothetical protein Q8S00_11385 [Deltaproteobacteria bacterium]|nr:hypothetical protein [Deltaproteobacteria bacterium]
MKQVLHSLKDGSTQLADVPSPRAASGQLLIRTSTTLVSAGTERMLIEFGKANLLNRFFRLLREAGLGVCTAETLFDAAQDRRRAQRKEFLIEN